MPGNQAGHNSAVGAQPAQLAKVGAHTRRNWTQVEKQRRTARVALRPHPEILKLAKVYCIEHDQTLTEFFEMAVVEKTKLGAHNAESVGALAPSDDDEDEKRDDNLLSSSSLGAHTAPENQLEKVTDLFQKYNTAFNRKEYKAGPMDLLTAHDLVKRSVDCRVIELGIIYTQANKLNGPNRATINSFRFYSQEIEQVAALNQKPILLDAMVEAYREHWTEMTGLPGLQLKYDPSTNNSTGPDIPHS